MRESWTTLQIYLHLIFIPFKVNGRDVANKDDTESLFAENKKAVTLLVSRCFNKVSTSYTRKLKTLLQTNYS